MALDKKSYDYQILLKTVFGECRSKDEPLVGKKAVAWVIKNRADLNLSYWGGNTIAGVCLHPGQFECWNGTKDKNGNTSLIANAILSEPGTYAEIDDWLPTVFQGSDPSGGADHYNNPKIEGYPDWTKNCNRLLKIGSHQFYKSKSIE